MAIMKIQKSDRDDNMFQDYDVKYGIRIYSDYDDTNPKLLGESTNTITLKAPKYKTSRFDEDVGLPEDVEYLSATLKDESVTVDPSSMTDFSGIS